MRLRGIALIACLGLAIAGCYQEPVALTTPAPESIPVTDLRPSNTPSVPATTQPTSNATAGPPTPIDLTPESPEPTQPTGSPPATPVASGPIAVGSPATDCINGWINPAADSAEYQAGIALLSAQMGVDGPWTTTEVRYFTGPDVPWIIEPHYDSVTYWYIRAALVDDPSFRARWLLEQRTDTIKGISAVAPFESFGYKSPDWTGFVGDGLPTSHLGLPGEWSGIPYDFVTGEGDSGQPGLPDGVVGCLSAT